MSNKPNNVNSLLADKVTGGLPLKEYQPNYGKTVLSNKQKMICLIIATIVLIPMIFNAVWSWMLSLDDKTLTYNDEIISHSANITPGGYIFGERYLRADRIFFKGEVGTSEINDMFSFKADDLAKKKEIKCKKHDSSEAKYPNLVVDGVAYSIKSLTPSQKCYIMTEANEYTSNVLICNIEQQRIVGTFTIKSNTYADFAVSPDDSKVAYIEQGENLVSESRQNVYVKDFTTGNTELVAESIFAASNSLRWINNNQLTFQGNHAYAYFLYLHAYQYDLSAKELIHFTDFQVYVFEETDEPSVETIFWTPDGKKLYYFVRNTNILKRWK